MSFLRPSGLLTFSARCPRRRLARTGSLYVRNRPDASISHLRLCSGPSLRHRPRIRSSDKALVRRRPPLGRPEEGDGREELTRRTAMSPLLFCPSCLLPLFLYHLPVLGSPLIPPPSATARETPIHLSERVPSCSHRSFFPSSDVVSPSLPAAATSLSSSWIFCAFSSSETNLPPERDQPRSQRRDSFFPSVPSLPLLRQTKAGASYRTWGFGLTIPYSPTTPNSRPRAPRRGC